MQSMYYRAQALESIARTTLMRLGYRYLNLPPQAVPIEALIEDVFGLSIEYKYLKQQGDELGKMIYDDGYAIFFDKDIDDYALMRVESRTMLIDASLTEAGACYGRLRFTYAHELAHWILHKQLFVGTGTAAAFHGIHAPAHHDQLENATEWQANYLATAILMPTGQIKRCFYALRNQGRSCLQSMADVFEVSKQAMQYRLNDLGLLR